jgi:hypothetical protein
MSACWRWFFACGFAQPGVSNRSALCFRIAVKRLTDVQSDQDLRQVPRCKHADADRHRVFNWAGCDRTPGSFAFTATNSFGSIAFVASEAAATPEPGSLFLMGSGALLGLRSYGKRRMIAV